MVFESKLSIFSKFVLAGAPAGPKADISNGHVTTENRIHMCGYVTLSSRPFQLLVLFFRPSPRPKLSFDQNNQHEQISVSLSWLYFVEKLNFDGYKTLSRRHSGFYFIDPV